MNELFEQLQISAFREPVSYNTISFYMRIKNKQTGVISVPDNSIVFKESHKDTTAVYIPPIFFLQQENAQMLMNDLWDIGIRPLNHSSATGELEATKRHLQDYRNLVSKLMARKGD